MTTTNFDKDAKWGNKRIRRGVLAMEIMREGNTPTMLEAHTKALEIMAIEDAHETTIEEAVEEAVKVARARYDERVGV